MKVSLVDQTELFMGNVTDDNSKNSSTFENAVS